MIRWYTGLHTSCIVQKAVQARGRHTGSTWSSYRGYTVHRQASRRHTVYKQCVYSLYRYIQTHIQRAQSIYIHIQCIYSPRAAHAQPTLTPVQSPCGAGGEGGTRWRHAVYIQCAYSPYSALYRTHTAHTTHIQPYTGHIQSIQKRCVRQ